MPEYLAQPPKIVCGLPPRRSLLLRCPVLSFLYCLQMDNSPKRRGRPRTQRQPQSWVSTKIPESDHDRLIRMVSERRLPSVAALIRAAIQAVLEQRTV